MNPTTAAAAIVFDMDGVLADTERLKFRAHRAAVEAVGGSLDPDLYATQMGSAHLGVIRAFLSASDLDTSDDAVERYEERFQTAYRDLLATDLQPMPGARALLAACRKQGRPLALVTSSEGWMADIVLRSLVRRDCSTVPGVRHGLGAPDVFEVVVTADDVEKEKPDPEPYLRARKALGFGRTSEQGGDGEGRGEAGDEAGSEGGGGGEGGDESGSEIGDGAGNRRIVAVEDTPAGIASASASGLPVIAVRHDFNRHHAFELASAVVASLDPPDRFLELVDEVACEGALP